MSFTNRAVGYCYAKECDDYLKGVFLLNYGTTFYCPRCRHLGEVLPEERVDNPSDNGLYTAVEMYFNYQPAERVYKARAIVKIEGVPQQHGTYVMRSPIVKTERRALKIAEQLLCALNAGLPKDNLMSEKTLTFDCSINQFRAQMEDLEDYVKAQDRRLQHAGR